MLATQEDLIAGEVDIAAWDAQLLKQYEDDPEQRPQAQIGVCFEEKNLYDAMSGTENLRFFAALYGVDGVAKRIFDLSVASATLLLVTYQLNEN